MAITFRNAGAWGSGKGAKLTSAEIDTNFWEVVQRLDHLESNPPTAVSIAEISISGNLITFTMTDSSVQGPFKIPSATMSNRGEWLPLITYLAFQLVANSGNIYMVLQNHVSESSFDAFATDGSGHDLYSLILQAPEQAYDLGMFYSFAIPVDGSELLQHVAARSFVVPGDFQQSVAFLRVATTTQTLTFTLYKNDEAIGHIDFVPDSNTTGDGGQLGTFVPLSPADDLQFDHGDRFKVIAPDLSPADDTAAGLSITLAARTGTIA
jgi:hypothetical protein